jgi:hypothetical protein
MEEFEINGLFSVDELDWNKQDETRTIHATGQSNPALLEAILAYHTSHNTDVCLPVQTCKQIERLSPNYTISGALNVNWESPRLRRGRCSMKDE